MMVGMRNARVELSADRADLYEPLMRSAWFQSEYEAAIRLVFRVEELWDWLMRWGCVEHVSQERYDILEVRFAKALELYRAGSSTKPGTAASELSDSLASVLLVAASLAGKEQLTMRFAFYLLEEDHARYVAEAVLHSAGFLDATADPWGGEPEGCPRGWGPHSTAREQRWWEDMTQPDEPR
ncbi:hypothetical protein KSE_71460 [Kitasatospora setae KM-6054]|uniref:Uncharacterized protein n=2 Tax=Streptomycetaceae TaxID=2062 RepID=E4NIV4_KITSK|nr:hypothetical protein KSE_71460 [Kitasatospora setae KM-6054]